MSYALSVYLVPEESLKRVVGSKDEGLYQTALASVGDRLADYDEQMHAPDLENNDVDISHAEALREIIFGEYTEGVMGSRYGWAFECLCDHLGESLDNRGFSPCDSDWYETLDELLAENEIPLSFQNLIFNSPVDIPESDDWPNVGHSGRESLAALNSIEALIAETEDPEISEALSSGRDWLVRLMGRPEGMLVGFHG